MKATMMKSLEWLDEYRAGERFVVRQYRAYHKLGRITENGLAFCLYEGQRLVLCKCPTIVDYQMTDKFVVEPSAKGLRVPKGCNGFLIWIGWYYDLYPEECEKFLYSVVVNSKMLTSGLSDYIRDTLTEGKQ